MNAGLTVDCSFGGQTVSAVTEFQSRCGLSADGAVGAQTIGVLVDILAGRRTMPEKVVVVVTPPQGNVHDYVLNTSTKKFHYPNCSSVNKIKASNRADVSCSREELIAQGYSPCGNCHP